MPGCIKMYPFNGSLKCNGPWAPKSYLSSLLIRYTFTCLVIDCMEPSISIYIYIIGVVNAIKRVE